MHILSEKSGTSLGIANRECWRWHDVIAAGTRTVCSCQTHDSLMLELPVLAILVNFDTLLSCTRTTVDTKEYSISNVFSACSGVVMYI